MVTYKELDEMMNGDTLGAYEDENGEYYIVQWEPMYDGDVLLYKAYRVSFVSKRTDNIEWWCHHIYHEDGQVEEMFEHVHC